MIPHTIITTILLSALLLPACTVVTDVSPSTTGPRSLNQRFTPQDQGIPAPDLLAFTDADALGEPDEGNPFRRIDDQSTVHLLSPSPRIFIAHLYDAIQAQDAALIERELLSQTLKDEVTFEGRSSTWAAQRLITRQDAVLRLLAAFPGGESTPGASYRIRSNHHILTANPLEAAAMPFGRLILVLEGSNFKLRRID